LEAAGRSGGKYGDTEKIEESYGFDFLGLLFIL
jgi:hypothetical protein